MKEADHPVPLEDELIVEETTLHKNLPLIETADRLLLDTLIADPATARLILVRLSDTVAAVAPDQFDALLARLRKLGHTPKVSEA